MLLNLFRGKLPPQAGVYTVHQASVLMQNTLMLLQHPRENLEYIDRGRIVEDDPQKSFLSLIMTEDRRAVGAEYDVASKRGRL